MTVIRPRDDAFATLAAVCTPDATGDGVVRRGGGRVTHSSRCARVRARVHARARSTCFWSH
jgi:hypothetical protein